MQYVGRDVREQQIEAAALDENWGLIQLPRAILDSTVTAAAVYTNENQISDVWTTVCVLLASMGNTLIIQGAYY